MVASRQVAYHCARRSVALSSLFVGKCPLLSVLGRLAAMVVNHRAGELQCFRIRRHTRVTKMERHHICRTAAIYHMALSSVAHIRGTYAVVAEACDVCRNRCRGILPRHLRVGDSII